MKYKPLLALIVFGILVTPAHVGAVGTTADAVLNVNTSPAQTLSRDSQLVELARIDITATEGDLYLQGVKLGTDVANGLQNFANIVLYNATTNAVLGEYPVQATDPATIRFSTIIIGYQQTKTLYIRGTPTASAASVIRVGFQDVVLGNEPATRTHFPIYGNAMTLPGAVPTPALTPTPLPSPTLSPSTALTPTALGFTSLAALGLSEGNTVSAASSDDPDVYIVNDWGYKRLFLNPVIFGFYAHLGGFANVKSIVSQTRNMLVTTGLFRNCETNDSKVYGVETTGEDMGILHWVNTSGAQAVQDDSDFFKKVFCINSKEFDWYPRGADYTSVSQVPKYSR